MFSLLFSKLFDAIVKRGNPYYGVTTILLATSLVISIWKIYKNYMKPYAEFTKFPLIIYIIYWYVKNKITKNLPITTVLFQECIRIGKRFQNEWAILIWIPEPFLVIFDKAAVKAFSNDPAFLDKPKKYELFKDVLGTGLAGSNGETWKRHRKLLNPVFHVGILKKKLSIITDSAEILVKNLEASLNETSIDIMKFIKPIAFGNLCEFVLGLKMNIPENKKIMKTFSQNLAKVNESILFRIINPWRNFKIMKNFTLSGRKDKYMLENLRNVTLQIISKMRTNMMSQQEERAIGYGSNEDDESRNSFAYIVLSQLSANSFTMNEIRDHVISFIIAGYDSLSYGLLWSLFLLGHHPEVQDQVYNEVVNLGDGNIVYEDLNKLKYLECVIKEALRLYPSIPVFAKTASKDVRFGNYNVPKGTGIILFPYLLHRDPEVYPDPEKFDPNRFMSGKSENYIPFAEGIRYCIAKRYAIMEMEVILAYIIRNFRIISLDRREDVHMKYRMVLAPAKPLRFRLERRN